MKWVIRIAGLFIALVAIGVLILVVLGRREGAGRVRASTEIHATPEQIWPYLTESGKVKQWITWLVEIRPDDPSKTGVGAREVWVMRDANNGGRTMEMVGVCTEYKPPSRLGTHVSSTGMFDGDQIFQIETLGAGKSRVSIDGKFRYTQWLGALFEPLVTPAAEKKLGGDVSRLKELVEKGAGNGSASSAL